MGEGGEIGDGVALDAEEMQTGSPWQDLVETIDDGDQSIRAMDGTPAHTADTNEPGTLSHVRERLGATLIITGMTSLNDRHEGSIDPGIFGTQQAFDVGKDGACHSVEHRVACAGNLLHAAKVEDRPPAASDGPRENGKTPDDE